MKLTELVTLLANKLSSLNNAKSTAIVSGDVERVIQLDSEITETQSTINAMQTLV